MKFIFQFIALFCFLFFAEGTSFSQSTLNKTTHDFGDINQNSERFIDFELTNSGVKSTFILRIEHPHDVVYKKSKDQVDKNEHVLLRFQVNPKNKGKFEYTLLIYMSDKNEAMRVTLKGNCTESISYNNALTDCPDFNKKPISDSKQLTVITIDKESGETLSQSSVSIIRNGRRAGMWITGRSGKFDLQLASGYFYVFASHDGYVTKEAGFYVSPEISSITIALSKDLESLPPTPSIQKRKQQK
jgi:Ca-activated chloride channel homolog